MAEPDEVPPFEKLAAAIPSFEFDQVRGIVEKHFRVYEVDRDVRGLPGAEVAAFYVMGQREQFDANFESVRTDIKALDAQLMVLLQYRMGEDVILVARRPPVRPARAGLNTVLLLATLVTTTVAGALWWTGYKQVEDVWMLGPLDATFMTPNVLFWGMVTFSIPLMLILGLHELGHWWIARKHDVHTSLPYFIPVPPPLLFGTFGAFISMKEPIPNRRALFDIGASGPIAGFLVTIPILVIGLVLTAVVAEELPPRPEIHSTLAGPDGTVWGFEADETTWTARAVDDQQVHRWVERFEIDRAHPGFATGPGWRLEIAPVFLEADATASFSIVAIVPSGDGFQNQTLSGELNLTGQPSSPAAVTFSVPDNASAVHVTFEWTPPASGLLRLGDSLAFLGLQWMVNQFVDTPDNVYIHPTALAGWVGLLVTAFNLLPAGQLDGGHVARALFGDRMPLFSYAAVALRFILSFQFAGWALLAVLVLLLGVRHPPPLNDRTELDRHRKALALVVVLVLVVSFVPVPLQMIP